MKIWRLFRLSLCFSNCLLELLLSRWKDKLVFEPSKKQGASILMNWQITFKCMMFWCSSIWPGVNDDEWSGSFMFMVMIDNVFYALQCMNFSIVSTHISFFLQFIYTYLGNYLALVTISDTFLVEEWKR